MTFFLYRNHLQPPRLSVSFQKLFKHPISNLLMYVIAPEKNNFAAIFSSSQAKGAKSVTSPYARWEM